MFYTGSLGTVSNSEDWVQEIDVVDENGDDVDISTATITLAVRAKGATTSVLEATNDDGITIASPRFTFTFDSDDMGTLCAGSYDVGCLVDVNDRKTQLIVGTVTIVDGIV